MTKTARPYLNLSLALLALALVISAFVPLAVRVAHSGCSPAALAYDSFAPYCAGLVEKRFLFKTVCAARIVKQADDLAGGYGVYLPAPGYACTGAATIAWTDDDVTLTFHGPEIPPAYRSRLTVPAAAVPGGR